MKIEHGIIAEATERELKDYWLRRGYDDFISFTDYLKACIAQGTKITENKEEVKL